MQWRLFFDKNDVSAFAFADHFILIDVVYHLQCWKSFKYRADLETLKNNHFWRKKQLI